MNRIATKTKITRLERRILKKAENLLPKTPRVVHSFLLREFRDYFRHVSPFAIFTRSLPPFYDFECRYANAERAELRQMLAHDDSLSPAQRAQLQKAWKLVGPAKTYRNLRPEFEKLKHEFISELTRINPWLARRHMRDSVGSRSRAEFERIRDSAWVAWCTFISREGPIAVIDQRFKKQAMARLPARLVDRFREETTRPCFLRHLKPFRPYIDEAEYEYVTEMALQVLRFVRHWQRSGEHPFRVSAYVKPAFRAALRKEDLEFFVRVGDVIRKRQIDAPDPRAHFTNLQQFLLGHWVDERDGVPPLYCLSIKELCSACKKGMNVSNYSEHAVEKTRQRLGLLTFRKGRFQGD